MATQTKHLTFNRTVADASNAPARGEWYCTLDGTEGVLHLVFDQVAEVEIMAGLPNVALTTVEGSRKKCNNYLVEIKLPELCTVKVKSDYCPSRGKFIKDGDTNDGWDIGMVSSVSGSPVTL